MSGGPTSRTITSTAASIVELLAQTDTPPADDIVNEVFFYRKCGRFKTDKVFFQNCINPTTGIIKNIKCERLGGSSGACDFGIEYCFSQTKGQECPPGDIAPAVLIERAANDTVSTTVSTNLTTSTTPVPSSTTVAPVAQIPTGFRYYHTCSNGPGKPSTIFNTKVVPREKMEEVMEFCRQELFGPPKSLPLWLILLIIFLVITAVSIASFLFWRYWLRKKLYEKPQRENSSSFGSFFTSAPFSSRSAAPSSAARSMPSAKRMGASGGSIASARQKSASTSSSRARANAARASASSGPRSASLVPVPMSNSSGPRSKALTVRSFNQHSNR